MKRKVIKQANQAHTITLPIDWVRKHNIDKDSEVDLIEDGKSLIINSDNKIAGERVTVDVGGLDDRNIARHINALYARGVDEIEVVCKEEGLSSKITGWLNQNIGYALVENKDGRYLIKDLGGQGDQDLDEIFKRVFQIILLFYESAKKDIFVKRKATIETLLARDFEVNKFCLFLQRSINKMSYPDVIKGRSLFTYSFALEKIGDEIQRMWRTSIKYKIKKNSEIEKLVDLSLEGLGKSFEFYYQFNTRKSEEIYKIREKVRGDSLKLLNLDSHTARFVRHVTKIVEEAADLSHLTLMMNLKNKDD